jgi:hypothetical protein
MNKVPAGSVPSHPSSTNPTKRTNKNYIRFGSGRLRV